MKRILVWLAILMSPVLFCHSGGKDPVFFTQGPINTNSLAITLDDGPGPQTEEFLALLKKYEVKATFFMLGEQVQARPGVSKKIKEEGHELASHTWEHINYKTRWKELGRMNAEPAATQLAKQELRQDLFKTAAMIETATGVFPRLVRMPHGIDLPWIKDVARENGVVLVNWTFGMDWVNLPQEQLEKSYREAVKPGAIILLHDGGSKKEKSLALLESVILEAKKKKLEIVPVGELLNIP